MAVAATCLAARRDAPLPLAVSRTGHHTFDMENPAVRGARGVHHLVLRAASFAALCSHSRNAVLASLAASCRRGVSSTPSNKLVHQGRGALIACVQIDSANGGFERVGQDGGPQLVAGLRLALAQAQYLQLQPHGDSVQRVLANQQGAHA